MDDKYLDRSSSWMALRGLSDWYFKAVAWGELPENGVLQKHAGPEVLTFISSGCACFCGTYAVCFGRILVCQRDMKVLAAWSFVFYYIVCQLCLAPSVLHVLKTYAAWSGMMIPCVSTTFLSLWLWWSWQRGKLNVAYDNTETPRLRISVVSFAYPAA